MNEGIIKIVMKIHLELSFYQSALRRHSNSKQQTPGKATAPNDPNSFGLGYEYSHTGDFILQSPGIPSSGNPTRGAYERAVAAAENAKYCAAFSSGSAAISGVIHPLSHVDNILCIDDVYGGTQRYFRRIAQTSYAIEIDLCDMTTNVQFTNNTKLLWVRNVFHFASCSTLLTLCHLLNWRLRQTQPLKPRIFVKIPTWQREKCILAVHNTSCSLFFQIPLDHGADLAVHSVTKYLGGHSDVAMGVVCTNTEELYRRLLFIQNGVGTVQLRAFLWQSHWVLLNRWPSVHFLWPMHLSRR
jgi:cystathionine gamma-lyase